MRRQRVPAVEVARFSARLDVLLRAPVIAPVYDRMLQPLGGISDVGELQEWEGTS